MIALIQRVKSASVTVNGEVTGAIGPGLCILLGVHQNDTEAESRWLARKCSALRIFSDEDGKMNRSVIDSGGEVIVVSQFTLYGSVERGNRPSFEKSAPPEHAESLYEDFVRSLENHLGKSVPTGVFGAMMDVELINDGPVTIRVEREPKA